MLPVIDAIMPYLHGFAFIAFFALLITAFIVPVEPANDVIDFLSKSKYFSFSLCLCVFAYGTLFMLDAIMSDQVRKEIKSSFGGFNPISDTLYVNRQILKNDSLVYAIQKIKRNHKDRHNGSLTFSIKLVKNHQNTSLRLVRDYADSSRYWVYYPKYKFTGSNCVGEVRTRQLMALH